jgi:hypothetical protein
VPAPALATVALAVAGAFVVGWPFFEFGFDWIANGNDDMANYVLLGTKLLHNGLLGHIDIAGLSQDRNYSTALQTLHSDGSRPGADIMLAGISGVTGRPPYEVFMPLIVAFNMSAVCGTAALAVQATRKWSTAHLAAVLLVTSPLAAFGVVQQLLPQVWGLGLAAAMFAVLMKDELHRDPLSSRRELVVLSILFVALILAYIELASSLVVAYAFFVLVLACRRRLAWRPLVVLWGVPLVTAALLVNVYLWREIKFVAHQAAAGVQSAGEAPQFGFALLPSALPALFGLQLNPPEANAAFLSASIAVALILLIVVLIAAFTTAARGVAASFVIVSYALLACYLAFRQSDFGLFKLYMYAQPFLAAAAAVWITSLRSRWLLAPVLGAVALLLVVRLDVAHKYVERTRNPIDLKHASDRDLLPAFRAQFASQRKPVVSVTENPTLVKLEAAYARERPLHLVTNGPFNSLAGVQLWRAKFFEPAGAPRVRFFASPVTAAVLRSNDCILSLPSGSQSVVNRRTFPEGSPDLVMKPCASVRNALLFVTSDLGGGFYGFENRKRVSFYQLEGDRFVAYKTFSGFGRYALFRVMNPSARVRVALDLTATLREEYRNKLPPARVFGATTVAFPLVGKGSARVFSPPVRPQIVDGQPYILLDMGRPSRLARTTRHGLQGLFSRNVPTDPRYLTSYVRDISLVSDAAFRALQPPRQIWRFPTDLTDDQLAYSGIYEDGWVGRTSYYVLSGGPVSTLVVRANVQLFRFEGQRLTVSVDGRRVVSQAVKPGRIEFRVRVPASDRNRRIDIRWAREARLRGTDYTRSAAARLTFVGLVSAPSAIDGVGGLRHPGLVASGIDSDGWLRQRSTAILGGGGRGTFVLRAQVPKLPGGREQRVRVLVDGRPLVSQAVPSGPVEIRAPAAASARPRRVAVVWSGVTRVAGNDRRDAAARLEYLGFLREYAPELVRPPDDLADPRLSYSGITKDGWLLKKARLLLAGGAPGHLTLHTWSPRANGLTLLVNGRTVASRAVEKGDFELKAAIPRSAGPRQIQLRWASSARLSGKDPRRAAALLQQIEVGSPKPPTALRNPQVDLAMPNVSSAGIDKDGWLGKEARVLLAGGERGDLVLRAEVITRKRQHLEVLVNGKTVAGRDVTRGLLELHIPVGPSLAAREVELRWATTSRISADDPRRAAALLKSVAIETGAPTSLDVAGLARSNAAFSGIYEDGWLQREARVLLTGGPSAELNVRAKLNAATSRHLEVLVNDRVVTGVDVRPGPVDLKIPIGPSSSARTVELRWSADGRISADDQRRAAALLQSIAIGSTGAPTLVRVEDVAGGRFAQTGIFKDGWLRRSARVLLAGGDAADLTVRADVTVKSGQRLSVFVNGRRVAGRTTPAGPLKLTVALPPSRGARVVELRWSRTNRIGPEDPRHGAARLKLIALSS